MITAKMLRKEFEDKLKELQENCKHETIEILPYMWAPGHFSGKVRVCSTCEKIFENIKSEISELFINDSVNKR